MLARRGWEVVAISGKPEQHDFLRAIGAARVMPRDALMAEKASMVSGAPFAAALDNVGGQMLDRLMAHMRPHGKICVAGMVGVELHTTVLPLVLRSVDVLGINVSRQLKMPERRRLWERLATDLKPRHLDKIARPIAFEELDRTMDSFFNVSTVGRVVVEVGERAPR
jgi:NADPH:quinone reductase-like Zn-dependent oxidoreductase